jgi:hypothetical protein
VRVALDPALQLGHGDQDQLARQDDLEHRISIGVSKQTPDSASSRAVPARSAGVCLSVGPDSKSLGGD